VVDALLTVVVVAAAGAISIAETEDVVAVVDMLATAVVDPDGSTRSFSFFSLLFSIPFRIPFPFLSLCLYCLGGFETQSWRWVRFLGYLGISELQVVWQQIDI
jgi:hypothetical protein